MVKKRIGLEDKWNIKKKSKHNRLTAKKETRKVARGHLASYCITNTNSTDTCLLNNDEVGIRNELTLSCAFFV